MTDNFIKKSKLIFGDKFDYSKTEYNAYKKEITLICKKHGEFITTPDYHFNKKSNSGGCPGCSSIHSKLSNERKNEQFILKLREKFGDKFDYSKIEYKGTKIPVSIICPEHGEFSVKPDHILDSKFGCPSCGHIENMKENERRRVECAREFPVLCSKIYNNKYDYSKVVYKNDTTPVIIICPEHGEFLASPNKHKWRGKECPVCSKKKKGKSYYENLTDTYCKNNNLDFIPQFKIDTEYTSNKPYDFFFKKLNLIFEINGSQHEEKRWDMTDEDLEKRKSIDTEKKRIALEENYNFLILRKPTINEIFKLFKLFNLEDENIFLEEIEKIKNEKILFFKNC